MKSVLNLLREPIQKYLDETLNINVPEIFLSDNLANGSGFVSFLNDNFNDLLIKLFKGSMIPDNLKKYI